MSPFRKSFWAAIFMMSILVLACVTINIYFPAEKVESVAGEIVNDVRGLGKPADDDSSSWLQRTFFAFSEATLVWAQEAATTVSNPVIRGLKDKMKERFEILKPYFKQGVISEGDDGYVHIKNADGLPMKERRDLKSLLDAENENRRTLYGEVAKALKIDSSQIDKIEKIFAVEWKKSLK